MTKKKTKLLFDDNFFKAFNSVDLNSIFIYSKSIPIAVDLNSQKLNNLLTNINLYVTSFTDSLFCKEGLILNIPMKTCPLGIPSYSHYSSLQGSTSKFDIKILKHLYDASVNFEDFTNRSDQDIYLDVSFIDLYSLSLAYFLIELYKASSTLASFKAICKSISSAAKVGKLTLNFTEATSSFELVRSDYESIFDYYNKEVTDFTDSSMLVKLPSDNFAISFTNYKLYCSSSSVSYNDYYSYLFKDEANLYDFIFTTSSPFLIEYSIEDYFNKLLSNSAFSRQEREVACRSVTSLVTGTINKLLSIEESTDDLTYCKISPITFKPITNISNVQSSSFSLDLFGSSIELFMNFNTGFKSSINTSNKGISFDEIDFTPNDEIDINLLLQVTSYNNLYTNITSNNYSLKLPNLYLIDPSYNYSSYFLGKGTFRTLPYSPYVFYKEFVPTFNNSATACLSSTTGSDRKHFYIRSLLFRSLCCFYTYASNLKNNLNAFDIESFSTDCQSFNKVKINSFIDYALTSTDEVEVNLFTYFYYLLKNSDNKESISMLLDLTNYAQ